MKYKKYALIGYIVTILLFAVLAAVFFLSPGRTNEEASFIANHTLIGPFLFILWRITGVLIPSIPAGVITFALVPVFGWFYTYIYTVIGLTIGTSVAFWLARIYREALVKKFLPLQKVHKLQNEMSGKQEFLAIVGIRVFTVPIMDFSSYVAGLTTISYKKFITATIIATIPDIFIFYFGDQLSKKLFGKSVLIGVIVFFIIAAGYLITKKYLSKKKPL